VDGDNAARGREALLGRGPRQNWLRRFLLSAYQSHLFNIWLAGRMERGWFESLLEGDVAKKTDTGGIFEVEDVEADRPRFEARQITYTGPIYGAKMRWAGGEPGQWEREVLAGAEVTEDLLKRARLDGSRRPGRLFLSYLDIQPDEQGLVFKFSLPKGSYATTVIREFTKSEPGLTETPE
jgi:tRNA pseudouridine13 synthase